MARLNFRFLSFSGEWHLQNRLNQRISADFYPKILFYSFYGRLFPELAKLASLSQAIVCPELNFLFQISSNEKDGILAKRSTGQSFGFFPLPPFHAVMIFEWPGFLSLFNRLQVIECEELTFVRISFYGQSVPVDSDTER